MVISVIIVILRILGLVTLPVTQYPDIAPPYSFGFCQLYRYKCRNGNENVVVPLEEQINGVEGMSYITSSAENDSSANIQIFF